MNKTAKRLLSMLLALSLVSGFAVPAAAAEMPASETEAVEETIAPEVVAEAENVSVDGSDNVVTLNTDHIELSFNMSTLWSDGDVEIDEEDPAIITMTQELSNIKVLNAEGAPVPMTQEQIQQVLYLYQQYLNHWRANADLLGVQTPFFLSYNDKAEDGLGILGEMLALAGISVDVVRAGYMSFDDITGMIQNFMYGDALGIQLYGAAVKEARQEIMDLIKSSGAVTEVQKYLVINDWLSHNTNFDMAYIMNEGGVGAMDAEKPVKHEYYDVVYNVIYGDYEKQLDATFRTQISDGLKAAMVVEFYNAAIKQGYANGALASGATQEQANAAAEQFVAENAAAIAADPNGFCVSAFGPEAAAGIAAQWDATWADWTANGIPGMVGQIKLTAYQAAIQSALMQGGQSEGDAAAFLQQNAAPIAANPYAFCVQAFGQAVADQLEAGINEQLKLMGIDPSAETNPQGAVSLTVITAMQMDTPQQDPMLQKPDGSYMTPNEAIKVFAAQAAEGLTQGVLKYWQGHHFGALGRGSAVCLGYTKAFTYLVQYLHPEVYGVNGAETDMSKAENWKTAAELYYDENGELDITRNYVVDTVRISFDARVTMFGESKDNFNSDHFWNAVQVDGQWYYIDPCYTDVYNTVMMRDRVETDGYINHMFFMFSHTSCANLYNGHYREIKTLYADVSTDKSYENAWIARVKSNTYFDGTYAYYFYDATDLIGMVEAFQNMNLGAFSMEDSFKIVRHKLTSSDLGDGDSDYETLIHFNYENEDSEIVTCVFDPTTGEMVEHELLTKLYAQFLAEKNIYPSLSITMALYNNKIYFNISNCIMSYDLATGAVVLVKEYNVIHGQRDKTNPFGGMAFSVVNSADQADFTVFNRPIAGMTIKADGNMYVSIATNFAFISGKTDFADQTSFGYEYEESNYNQNYSMYGPEDLDSLLQLFGYTKEINDNDEFMWTANFVETLAMSDLTESGAHKHTFQAVSVDASCNRNAFTENRCTTCGVSQPGTRVEIANTAHDHHYVYFQEQFYTKNKTDGSWNTGFCYVCTKCNQAITKPSEFDENTLMGILGNLFADMKQQHEKEQAAYEYAVAVAGHTYEATDAEWAEDGSYVIFSVLECTADCMERKYYLDCLREDATIAVSLKEEIVADAVITGGYGNCAEGATAIYTASGKTEEGFKYNLSKEVTLKAGEHPYVNGMCAVCGDVTAARIVGRNRYNTALLTAEVLKLQMGVEKFDAIVVACGNDYADALSGSYLANKKGAPILLVNKNNLNSLNDVVSYIAENLAEEGLVYILGGTGAVPADMEEKLMLEGIASKRLAGNGRYDTNLLILKEAGVEAGEDILICTGNDYADALSASATGMPILLVNKNLDKLRDDQKAFLASVSGHKLYIIGGTGAVSENIAKDVKAYGDYKRLAGSGRYETSVIIAEEFFDAPTTAILAYGHNFPDGLCGGALGYYMEAPVILTRDKTKNYAVDYAKAAGITKGFVLGGDTLISDETVLEILQIS